MPALSNLWPNKTVFYTFNANLPQANRSYIENAMAHWRSKTNIQFVPRTNEANYVEFVPGSSCSSFIGMVGGRQEVNIGSGCLTGQAIHEIGHAIGFYHEQSRSDRDNYVTINFNSIIPGQNLERNFQAYVQSGELGFELGTFDFNSIMLYNSFSFAIDYNHPTIVTKTGQTFEAQRDSLSQGDKETYNYMYNPSIYAQVEYTQTRNDYDWSTGSSAVEGDVKVYFYADANKTSPLTLTSPITMYAYDFGTKTYSFMKFPAGYSVLDLGKKWEYQTYDNGNLISYSAGGIQVYAGAAGYTMLPYIAQ